MKFTKFSKYTGEPADGVDLQELIKRLLAVPDVEDVELHAAKHRRRRFDDREVEAACAEHDIVLVTTGIRLFLH